MEHNRHTNKRWIQVSSSSLNSPLSICLNEHANVASLKRTIEAKHPQQPLPNDQEVIFCGSVLLDSEILLNILEQTDNSTIPTFHLIVKPPLSDSIPSTSTLYTLGSSNSLVSQPVPPPINSFGPSTIPPAYSSLPSPLSSISTTGYHVIAINGQFYLAPVLLPTPNTLIPFSTTGPGSMPMAARDINRPRTNRRGARVSLVLKLAFVLLIVCYDASFSQLFFFLLLSLVFLMYRTGRIRLVVRRAPL